MPDEVYFDDPTNKPARRQWYTSRRNPARVIVVHSTESDADVVLPDDGAEGVTDWIRRRPNAGSYHSIADSDGVVRLGRFGWTMFHCRNYNSSTFGLSFACRHDQWDQLPHDWTLSALAHAANEAVAMSRSTHLRHGWYIPAVGPLSKADVDRGARGFTSHAILDPTRRRDPGPGFPWAWFLTLYRAAHKRILGVDPGGIAMPQRSPLPVGDLARIQTQLVLQGYDLGTTGPANDGIDDAWGPKTKEALDAWFSQGRKAVNQVEDLKRQLEDLKRQLDEQPPVSGPTPEHQLGVQVLDLLESIRDASESRA